MNEETPAGLVRCADCGTDCKARRQNVRWRKCVHYTKTLKAVDPEAKKAARREFTREVRQKVMKAGWITDREKLGRPTVWTDEKLENLKRYAKRFKSIARLALFLGIPASTVKDKAKALGIELNKQR